VPAGFGVFTAGQTYFHEGVSLQECIVPLVVLHAAGAGQPTSSAARVTLTYRSNRLTSRIATIKAVADGNLFGPVEVRIEAYLAGAGAGAGRVGEAADCDARSPETRLVSLDAGTEVSVPIRIDDDFSGPAVEIRALDPVTGRILGALVLENAAEDW
jgi:hypothetical protein